MKWDRKLLKWKSFEIIYFTIINSFLTITAIPFPLGARLLPTCLLKSFTWSIYIQRMGKRVVKMITISMKDDILSNCKLSWHVAEVRIDLPEFHWMPESNNASLQLAFISYGDHSKPQDACYNTALGASACLERFFSGPGKVLLNYKLVKAIALPHFLLPYKMAATWTMQV